MNYYEEHKKKIKVCESLHVALVIEVIDGFFKWNRSLSNEKMRIWFNNEGKN